VFDLRRGEIRTYDSRASPTRISMLFMLFLANASWASLAYSGENSRPVTCPSGPTADAHLRGVRCIRDWGGERLGIEVEMKERRRTMRGERGRGGRAYTHGGITNEGTNFEDWEFGQYDLVFKSVQ
jgi:hypothetical protein